MGKTTETFQISREAAELYETKFVPALFAQWAPLMVEMAGVDSHHSVLDVACGTGVLSREVSRHLDEEGSVVGLDLNPAMLTVASRMRPDLEWREGDAAALPFPDSSFDVVLCQSGLMFFPDPDRAVAEMARVAVDGGTVGVQVYGELETQPGYGPFVEIAARHAGPEAREALGTYWKLGDPERLGAMLESSGLEVSDMRAQMGTACFDSVEDMVETELEASPLQGRIDAAVHRRIVEESEEALAEFRTGDGAAHIPIRAIFVTAHR